MTHEFFGPSGVIEAGTSAAREVDAQRRTRRRASVGLFALALVATTSIGAKVLVGIAPDIRDAAALKRTLVARLVAEGFIVDETPGSAEISLMARRGVCRLTLTEARPQGWNNALIELQTGETGKLKFFFQGEMIEDLPRYRATWQYQTARILRQVGGRAKWHPVLAIWAGQRCPARLEAFAVPLAL
jgi:hypothetical protein